MAITISDNRMPDMDAVDTAVVRKLRGLRLTVCPTAGCVIALRAGDQGRPHRAVGA